MENIDIKKKTIIRLLILLMCAMIIPVSLIAQNKIRSGVKGGLNANNLFIDRASDESAHLPIGYDFAIQPEILFNTKGAKASYALR